MTAARNKRSRSSESQHQDSRGEFEPLIQEGEGVRQDELETEAALNVWEKLQEWVHAARQRELRYWFDLEWNIQSASDSLRGFLNLRSSWRPGQLFELQNYLTPEWSKAERLKRPYVPKKLWNKFTVEQKARYKRELIPSAPTDVWLPIDSTPNGGAGVLNGRWMARIHSERIEIGGMVVGRWVAVLLHDPLTKNQLKAAVEWAHQHPLTERPPEAIVNLSLSLIQPTLEPSETPPQEDVTSVENARPVERARVEVERVLADYSEDVRNSVRLALAADVIEAGSVDDVRGLRRAATERLKVLFQGGPVKSYRERIKGNSIQVFEVWSEGGKRRERYLGVRQPEMDLETWLAERGTQAFSARPAGHAKKVKTNA